MATLIRIIKLSISGLLLLVWMLATVIMLLLAMISVMGLIFLISCPEFFLLWCLPAILLLVFGGWIGDETANSIKEALGGKEDRGDDFFG